MSAPIPFPSRFNSYLNDDCSSAGSSTSARRLAVRLLVGGQDLSSPVSSPNCGRGSGRPNSPGHLSPSSPLSPHPTARPPTETTPRRKLRNSSQSERPERPASRLLSSSGSASNSPTASRDDTWAICDRLNNLFPARPSSPARTGSTSSSFAGRGKSCRSAVPATAAPAHDGRWLASGFDDLQQKLELFAQTTQHLAESLDDARSDAEQAREALRAVTDERDMLVTEMENTLAAWSASEQTAAVRQAELEQENERLRQQLRKAEADKNAAVAHGKAAAAKAAAAARPVTLVVTGDEQMRTDGLRGRSNSCNDCSSIMDSCCNSTSRTSSSGRCGLEVMKGKGREAHGVPSPRHHHQQQQHQHHQQDQQQRHGLPALGFVLPGGGLQRRGKSVAFCSSSTNSSIFENPAAAGSHEYVSERPFLNSQVTMSPPPQNQRSQVGGYGSSSAFLLRRATSCNIEGDAFADDAMVTTPVQAKRVQWSI